MWIFHSVAYCKSLKNLISHDYSTAINSVAIPLATYTNGIATAKKQVS